MIDGLARTLKQVPEHIRMACIKTLVNGWATSSRYQESIQHFCLFGCRGTHLSDRDSLRHYLICNPLWTVIATTMGLGGSFVDLNTIQRLGLESPSKTKCYMLALAYRVYHAIKMDYLPQTLVANTLGDYSPIHELMIPLAKHHWNEIRDNQAYGSASQSSSFR